MISSPPDVPHLSSLQPQELRQLPLLRTMRGASQPRERGDDDEPGTGGSAVVAAGAARKRHGPIPAGRDAGRAVPHSRFVNLVPTPPADLIAAARATLASIGYAKPAGSVAYGFDWDVQYLRHVETTNKSRDRSGRGSDPWCRPPYGPGIARARRL